MIRNIINGWLVVLALIMSGCVGNNIVKVYEGERDSVQIAHIKMPASFALKSIGDRVFGLMSRPPGDEKGLYEIQLSPGNYLITFFYSQYWEDLHEAGGNGYIVDSENVAVRADLKAGHHYVMRYIAPTSKSEAFKFVRNMKIALVDEQDGTQFVVLPANHPNLYLPVATTTTNTGVMQQEQKAVQEDPFKHLKFWWLMADEKQRQTFLEWMKNAKP